MRPRIQHVTVEFDLDPAEWSKKDSITDRRFVAEIYDSLPEYLLDYAVPGSVVVTTTPKPPRPEGQKHAGST